jgi:hypothetical protein
MSELDAGLLIGGGAVILFGALIYFMSNRSDEEDEATVLYRELMSSLDAGRYTEALELANKHLIVLSAKTQNANDLGESYFLIAKSADHLGLQSMTLLAAGIANYYLDEKAVESYPLYRKCREQSIEIQARNRAEISSEKAIKLEKTLAELCESKLDKIDELLLTLDKNSMN